jgi:hypothetical protein
LGQQDQGRQGIIVNRTSAADSRYRPDSPYAWGRVAASLGLATVGGIGLWAPVVVLTTIQNEFGVGRAGGSLPYTATMVGFAVGGVTLGRVADKFGILPPLLVGAVMLGLGFIAGAFSTSYWQFIAVQAVLIGMLGSSATFGPLVADTTHWFHRQRGGRGGRQRQLPRRHDLATGAGTRDLALWLARRLYRDRRAVPGHHAAAGAVPAAPAGSRRAPRGRRKLGRA